MMSRLAVDIDTARKNLNSHDWVAVDMYDSLSKDHKKYDRYYHKLIEDVSDDQNSNKD